MAQIKVNSPPPYFVGQIFLGQCDEEASIKYLKSFLVIYEFSLFNFSICPKYKVQILVIYCVGMHAISQLKTSALIVYQTVVSFLKVLLDYNRLVKLKERSVI